MLIQIQFSTPDAATANKIANVLVKEKLAACVQIIGPITSTYHWEGKIEQAEEYLCLVKCQKTDYVAIETKILSLHPYEIPEIIATDIVLGLSAYLDWVVAETKR